MTATLSRSDLTGVLAPQSPNGHEQTIFGPAMPSMLLALWRKYGPYLIAMLYLILGYLHYAPGADYSLSAERYRAWAFPAFRYSDLIWLFLRDGLDRRPLPYVDYRLEYPPLTGFLSWILSWSATLPTYFALAYLILAGSALLAIWSLQRLDSANVWLFAASPALFFYTGHQWDMAAIGVSAIGLLAAQRGRDSWAIGALVIATSLKLFPLVFIVALIVERLRDRHLRSATWLATLSVAGTALINLPVAFVNVDGWSFFFRWNRDRLADSGIWVLWRDVPTVDLTRWSMVAAVAGGVALTLLAFRTRGPIAVPLGASYLLWWLLVNKTFTTHLMLWVLLSLALLSAPWWLWGLATACDVVGFQLGNYLNLYNIPEYEHAPLIRKAVENAYDPLQIARSAFLLVCSLFAIRRFRQPRPRAQHPAQSLVAQPLAHRASPQNTPLNIAASLPDARRIATATGLIAALALVTIVMTWPYAQHLDDATIVGFDPLLQIWLSEWIQHILVTDPLQLYDANIFYPFAQTLAYTDANIPGALLAAPLRWLTGDPILTNSLLVLATFVLAGAGVYALIVHLTGDRSAAFVSGLAYAFLPYRMVHLWHLNWLEGAVLPWVILALFRLVEHPRPTRGIVLGLLAAILSLISFYFTVQIALVAVVIVVAWCMSRRRLPPRAFVRSVLLALAFAAAVLFPAYAPYLAVRDEQGLERTLVDAEQYKALPESYLQLAPWDEPNALQRLFGVRAGPNESLVEVGQAPHADGHQHGEIVSEDALYPGALVIVFAVIGLTLPPRRWIAVAFAVIALAAFVLSLGPSLGPKHGAGLPLPYGWLFDHIALFRAMRVPARLGGLVDLMLVLLAGIGIARAWEWVRRRWSKAQPTCAGLFAAVLTGALVLAILFDFSTGSVPLEPLDRGPAASAAADWLARQAPGPVMEFPAESVFADPAAASVRRHYGETMFWSTRHWLPLVNGNSGFIPRAYSDFIERFVGQLPRADGSLTLPISHVNGDTINLLSQIGVRYIVFHRGQYRQEDWPAVAAQLQQLQEQGRVTPAGDHGESTIYLLNPMLPASKSPNIRLFAPSLITAQTPWSPWLGIEKASESPAVLALTRPAMLETTWYDNDGKQLWQGSQQLPLPVVLDEPRLLCSASDCLTTRPLTDLSRLPPPDSVGSWNPEQPGHYLVRLRLNGDHSLDCTVDVDLVDSDDEVRKRAGDDTYRWAECREDSSNPVNNPGALPFQISPPSVTLYGDSAAVDITLTTRADEEVQGWFILAPPGEPEPWREAVFQSLVQQKLIAASAPSVFEWNAPIGESVAPGIYQLTVWFHRRGDAGWEHAAGGDIALAPIIVDADRTLRWAGPVRATLAGPPDVIVPGRATPIDLTVTGLSPRTACAARWSLYSGDSVVSSGNAGNCRNPEVLLPSSTAVGHYRLQLDLLSGNGDEPRLSDAVSFQTTVAARTHNGIPN